MGNDRNRRVEGGMRWIDVPPEPEQLAPLGPECAVVQTRDSLTGEGAEQIAALLETDPEVMLRVYGHGTAGDLSFLEHFPNLRRLEMDDQKATGFEGLRFAKNLVELSIIEMKKKVSLAPLAALTSLEELFIEKQSKDLGILAELPKLREVTLVGQAAWRAPAPHRGIAHAGAVQVQQASGSP